MKGVLGTSLILGMTAPALAEFPEKPITMVVGFKAGGGSDTAARLMASELEKSLGQKIIVTNRGGAGGGVAAAYIRQQPKDGYTIGFAVATTFAFDPLLGNVAHGLNDFSYIAAPHGYRSVFVSPIDAPYKDFKGMISYAKERGWLNYASIIPLDRMIMNYIGKQEGLKVNIVPTRGGAGARQAVLGGHVDVSFSGSNALPMHEQGAVRIVASALPTGMPDYPDIPSLKSLGYDIYSRNYAVFFGPKDIDEQARKKLEMAMARAVRSPVYSDYVRNKFRGREIFLSGGELKAELEMQAKDFRHLLKATEE
ncbi:tripartite tricarboxylate transporter substrate binding protein [Marinomonas sp. 15G1-11]|uniref:Tripartite tricarboxylate transporter substrate binding protein n=1 Tax=Marinomonas phaeophyticola TaxID=3004091 RepID=A0ABT4JW91_9GAMM|nr:tripartite tricarboxylate transporter substrate binding protein [Marinomonas sp. 15G1-11]MCZ2722652.1 tripartite tricarboxylate transporter substrate binding protein [Marinomonas sp. 15G1-11]